MPRREKPGLGQGNPCLKRKFLYYQVDLIGISAGFDNHEDDWGGLLATEDYFSIGTMVRQTARACGGGCFAILEGGYNHDVLGHNVAALIDGLSS